MRCCNCRYCCVDSWDESDWTCGIFGSNAEYMITEDKTVIMAAGIINDFLRKKKKKMTHGGNNNE